MPCKPSENCDVCKAGGAFQTQHGISPAVVHMDFLINNLPTEKDQDPTDICLLSSGKLRIGKDGTIHFLALRSKGPAIPREPVFWGLCSCEPDTGNLVGLIWTWAAIHSFGLAAFSPSRMMPTPCSMTMTVP